MAARSSVLPLPGVRLMTWRTPGIDNRYALSYCSTVPHQASSIWIARPSSSSMNSALWVHPRWRGFCGFRQRQVPRLLPSAITGSAKPSRPVRRSSLLRKALGTDQVPELLTTVRQQSERERETTLLFREGKAGAALARKDEDSTLALAPGGYRDAVRRVAELWSERQQATLPGQSTGSPSPRRPMRMRERSRPQFANADELPASLPDIITLQATDQNGAEYDLTLTRGDRVRLFSNTPAALSGGRAGNIGRNGSVLEVLDISTHGVQMRNAKGTDGWVKWETLRDPLLAVSGSRHGIVSPSTALRASRRPSTFNALPSGSRTANANTVYVAESHTAAVMAGHVGWCRAPRDRRAKATWRCPPDYPRGRAGQHGSQPFRASRKSLPRFCSSNALRKTCSRALEDPARPPASGGTQTHRTTAHDPASVLCPGQASGSRSDTQGAHAADFRKDSSVA